MRIGINTSMNTVFFLARHGETQWNKLKKLQGQLDSPLTDMGQQQAKDLGQGLRSKNIKAIVSSPLLRAVNTAKICQQILTCPLTIQAKLKERHFGSWQGKLQADVKTAENYQAIFFQALHHSPPNGESGQQCAQRFQQTLIELAQQHVNNNVLIISHGDILRCFLANMAQQGVPSANIAYNNACLLQVNYNHHQQEFTYLAPSVNQRELASSL